ncbi:MAG: hypothetical protein HY272_13910 [Gammaproteobacteria bacterium]|nr:hypothetical protein [Gammaproteobacteria bacterium]
MKPSNQIESNNPRATQPEQTVTLIKILALGERQLEEGRVYLVSEAIKNLRQRQNG